MRQGHFIYIYMGRGIPGGFIGGRREGYFGSQVFTRDVFAAVCKGAEFSSD